MFFPYEKGRVEHFLGMLKGGTTSFGGDFKQ